MMHGQKNIKLNVFLGYRMLQLFCGYCRMKHLMVFPKKKNY